MKPLIVLIISFIVSTFAIFLVRKEYHLFLSARIAMSIMLFFTSIAHFVFSEGMMAMIPDILPFKKAIVHATGVLEILFAIGILTPQTKIHTGWTLILFFIVILPANIKASMEHINYQTGELNGHGLDYLWFRIPLQLLFIGWVFFSVIRNTTNKQFGKT